MTQIGTTIVSFGSSKFVSNASTCINDISQNTHPRSSITRKSTTKGIGANECKPVFTPSYDKMSPIFSDDQEPVCRSFTWSPNVYRSRSQSTYAGGGLSCSEKFYPN
ncbi:hypothetical protein TNCV_2402551 [Trichonephila clavipes]|nr:hypothetical protein TNCV_2402551 [Trichonephila clavipes]